MRILALSTTDLLKSAHSRQHQLVDFLSEKHEMTVFCLNAWWLKKEDGSPLYRHTYNKNVDIRYFSRREINPAWQEVELSARFYMHLDPALLEYDVFVNFDSLISGFTLARKLKRKGKAVVFDVDDDLPEMIRTSASVPFYLRPVGRAIGARRLVEGASDADRIVCVIDSLRNSYGLPSEKSVEIPNGVDTRLFGHIDSTPRHELDLDGVFVIGYSGVLREWVDLEPIFLALRQSEDMRLLVIGEEGFFRENVELSKRHGVESKVLFTGTVPFGELPRYISVCDACVIPFRRNEVTTNAVPLKLFEYLACEKPVISTPIYGVRRFVGDRIKYYSDSRELLTQIGHLRKEEKHRLELGIEGRRFVESNYSWNVLCQRFEDVLIDAVSRRQDWT